MVIETSLKIFMLQRLCYIGVRNQMPIVSNSVFVTVSCYSLHNTFCFLNRELEYVITVSFA